MVKANAGNLFDKTASWLIHFFNKLNDRLVFQVERLFTTTLNLKVKISERPHWWIIGTILLKLSNSSNDVLTGFTSHREACQSWCCIRALTSTVTAAVAAGIMVMRISRINAMREFAIWTQHGLVLFLNKSNSKSGRM